MLHISGDSNVADHLSRIASIPEKEVSKLQSFISVFDSSATFDAIISAQSTCVEPWYIKIKT